jgi:hypothetical protein
MQWSVRCLLAQRVLIPPGMPQLAQWELVQEDQSWTPGGLLEA